MPGFFYSLLQHTSARTAFFTTMRPVGTHGLLPLWAEEKAFMAEIKRGPVPVNPVGGRPSAVLG